MSIYTYQCVAMECAVFIFRVLSLLSLLFCLCVINVRADVVLEGSSQVHQQKQALTQPRILEPRFIQLSSKTGLSQDTVHDLLIDKDGFLWTATETGLNRFDGHRNIVILDKDEILLDAPIYKMFQDSEGMLWLSVGNQGIYRFDLLSRKAENVLKLPYKDSAEWIQYAVHMFEKEQGVVSVVLNEHVVEYNLQNKTTEFVFDLPLDEFTDGDAIRFAHWVDNVLLIGTTKGLFGFNPSKNILKQVHYIEPGLSDLNSINVKYINQNHATNKLLIGTVSGLYELNLAQTLSYLNTFKYEPEYKTLIKDRNIWEVTQHPENIHHFYIGTDKGLFTLDTETLNAKFILEPRELSSVSAKLDISDIELDRHGNLWLSTFLSGAFYWSPNSLLFENIFNSRLSEQAQPPLTDNTVWSFHQDNDDLFVGTQNGLTKYNLVTQESVFYLQEFTQNLSYSDASILKILPGPNNTLWLETGNGIRLFDVQTGKTIPVPLANETNANIFADFIFGMVLDGQDNLWFQSISHAYRYDVQQQTVEQIVLPFDVNPQLFSGFIGAQENNPNVLYLSAVNTLYSFNTLTREFTMLHKLAEQRSIDVVPSSVVTDKKGQLWVAYPSYGIVVLEPEKMQEIALFNKGNMLKTNLVYGLQEDSNGNMWFSSHSGLHKIITSTNTLVNYHYANGLNSVEFNQGASLSLANGDFVYGSPKGITRFSPELISENYTIQKHAYVTAAKLSNRELSAELTVLNNRTITLKNADAGLLLYFSTLDFTQNHESKYTYRLTRGHEEIVEATTNSPKVMFSQLEPGEYELCVHPFGMESEEHAKSPLTIIVPYSPFMSPAAYFVYAVVSLIIIVSISSLKIREAKLRRKEQEDLLMVKNRLSNAMKASNSNIWEYCPKTQKVIAERFAGELGFEVEGGIPFDLFLNMIHRSDVAKFKHAWQKFITEESTSLDISYRIIGKDRKSFWYRDVGDIITHHDGMKKSFTGTYTNITESIIEQERVKLFGDAFKNTSDWVLIMNRTGQFIAANPSCVETFAIDENKDLTQQLYYKFKNNKQIREHLTETVLSMRPNQSQKKLMQLHLPSKETVDIMYKITAIENSFEKGKIDNFLIIMTDITEQKKAERKLQEIANFDSLTGLANRSLLLERLESSLTSSLRHQHELAVIFIDLDRFKPINDTYGHEIGDKVLKEIGGRLNVLFRKNDTVARLGGDEFVVVIEDVKDRSKLDTVLKKIINTVEAPISLYESHVSVTPSLGVSIFPQDGMDGEQLIRCADIAMYNVKGETNVPYQFYTQEMNDKARDHLLMQNNIKSGHSHNEFFNNYQGIWDLESESFIGFELLMRWHDGSQNVSPADFIPVAEEIGMIIDMTRDAIYRGIQDLALWYEKGFTGYLSLNLSTRHFENEFNILEIEEWLKIHNLPHSSIRFEITEGVLMKDDEKALMYMNEIRDSGFAIALDDFGTGYSSLRYLKDFPFHVIKIDKSFVDGIGLDKNDEVIILTTISMAESMGMSCVAEGIETQEQAEFLRNHNCRYIQGYLYSKPAMHEATLALIEQDQDSQPERKRESKAELFDTE